MSRVIDPILADMQWEEAEAYAQSPWRRHLVRTRARLAFWRALILHLCTRRRSESSGSRAAAAILAVLGATVAITTVVVALQFAILGALNAARGDAHWVWLLLYLVAPSLRMTLPAGILVGLTIALARGAERRVPWIPIAAVACSCAILSVVLGEWAIPEANHAYRVQSLQARFARTGEYIEPLPRRVMDSALRWSDLRARVEIIKEIDYYGLPVRPSERAIWLDYHVRAALPITSMILSVLAVSLSAMAQRRIKATALALFATLMWFFTFYWAQTLVIGGALSAFSGAWLPNLVAALMAFLAAKPLSTLRAKLAKHSAA